jgi:3-carboxy-cis,cis-muconate cycloisomerase
MAEVAQGVSVDAQKMRVNIQNTNGEIFAERAMMLLATKLGRDVAHKILEAAVRKSIAEGKHLAAVLAETPELETHLSRVTLTELEIPEQYLGSAEAFRNALAAEPDRRNNDYEDNDCEDEDCEDEDRKDVDPQNNDPRDNN